MLQQRFTGSKRVLILVLGLGLAFAASPAWAQQAPPPPPLPPPGQTLTPDQLDDLVAPIALYRTNY